MYIYTYICTTCVSTLCLLFALRISVVVGFIIATCTFA